MKRRQRDSRPPAPGGAGWGGVLEGVGEEEKAGRPLAPLMEYAEPRPDFDAMARAIEEGRFVSDPADAGRSPAVDLTPAGPPPTVPGG